MKIDNETVATALHNAHKHTHTQKRMLVDDIPLLLRLLYVSDVI